MSGYTQTMERLIAELGRLPGIGARSAERIAFHLLKAKTDDAMRLADAIRDLKTRTRHCSRCYNLTEADPCPICSDPARDARTICVVEQPKDLMNIESTGTFRGVYHVLMGHLAPLEGVEPADLTIDPLLRRVESEGVREVILGTNPTIEGDGTALLIASLLAGREGVQVTRLARGLPSGSQLEYANKSMLADAISGRQKMG
ncbi:MAG: recombination mediator RecR [Phycisphaerae bacterium]|nr:recombination mediator RecR [Phycisphaerae bacterium]